MTKFCYLGSVALRVKVLKNRIKMFPVQTPLGTQLLFGCPTANFEPLPKGQPHYLDVNHCAFYNFDPKVTRRLVTTRPCYEVPIDIMSKLFQCRD